MAHESFWAVFSSDDATRQTRLGVNPFGAFTVEMRSAGKIVGPAGGQGLLAGGEAPRCNYSGGEEWDCQVTIPWEVLPKEAKRFQVIYSRKVRAKNGFLNACLYYYR